MQIRVKWHCKNAFPLQEIIAPIRTIINLHENLSNLIYTEMVKADAKYRYSSNFIRNDELTSGDCSKTFLTSSVPNLELDTFAIKLNRSYLKVNATSRQKKRTRLSETSRKKIKHR